MIVSKLTASRNPFLAEKHFTDTKALAKAPTTPADYTFMTNGFITDYDMTTDSIYSFMTDKDCSFMTGDLTWLRMSQPCLRL